MDKTLEEHAPHIIMDAQMADEEFLPFPDASFDRSLPPSKDE
jgi:hypothetical protein